MKKQNTICRAYDKNDNCITFERFTQKTARGVLSQYRQIYKSALCGDCLSGLADLYFRDYRAADRVIILQTCENGEYVLADYSAAEFFAALS